MNKWVDKRVDKRVDKFSVEGVKKADIGNMHFFGVNSLEISDFRLSF